MGISVWGMGVPVYGVWGYQYMSVWVLVYGVWEYQCTGYGGTSI